MQLPVNSPPFSNLMIAEEGKLSCVLIKSKFKTPASTSRDNVDKVIEFGDGEGLKVKFPFTITLPIEAVDKFDAIVMV